ncbi:MAG: metallophosphoesterase family protein [Microthrixaceae bacterium]|nr:metallophosphoesterase family protein [Microthrixaceae bacterium]
MTRIVVLSDTHVSPRSTRQLPDEVYRNLAATDLILHAGDLVSLDMLRELEGFAPVHAVLGNNDHELLGLLPERFEVEVEGIRFGLVHDSGDRQGRAARMRRWFPDADVVVFGHSHEPCNEAGDADQVLFNPGSSTWKRRAPSHTFGVIEVGAGQILRAEILEV